MGTNWGIGSSVWTWGRTSSLWGWWSTGTGCPGRLWSLILWRYSRPAWTRSCAACSRWPCFSRRVGLDDPQRSLPTPNILWFCEATDILLTPTLRELEGPGHHWLKFKESVYELLDTQVVLKFPSRSLKISKWQTYQCLWNAIYILCNVWRRRDEIL